VFRINANHKGRSDFFVELLLQGASTLHGRFEAHQNPPRLIALAQNQRRRSVFLLPFGAELLRLSAVRKPSDLDGV